jgi:hypothetical protein
MTMLRTLSDEYLASLRERADRLDRRQAEVERRHAEAEAAYQREHAAIVQERIEVDASIKTYSDFLQSRGRTPSAAPKVVPVSRTVVAAEDLNRKELYWVKRLGAKHAEVLLAIGAQGATTRDVSTKTGVKIDVVRNFMHADSKRGMVKRRGEKVHLTPVGERVLRAFMLGDEKQSAPSLSTGGASMQ